MNNEYPLDTTSSMPEQTKGFATTPEVLKYGGPQMEDYPDWDSWYFARKEWVFKKMNEEYERKGL